MPAPAQRKSHPPVGAQHYAPAIIVSIRHRAAINAARAAGVSLSEARQIISARMPDRIS